MKFYFISFIALTFFSCDSESNEQKKSNGPQSSDQVGSKKKIIEEKGSREVEPKIEENGKEVEAETEVEETPIEKEQPITKEVYELISTNEIEYSLVTFRRDRGAFRVFEKELEGTIPLFKCMINDDSRLYPPKFLSISDCSKVGRSSVTLEQLGFIDKVGDENGIPLYRCFNEQQYLFKVSTFEEGCGDGYVAEGVLGFFPKYVE